MVMSRHVNQHSYGIILLYRQLALYTTAGQGNIDNDPWRTKGCS